MILYAAVRIIDGLIVFALRFRPLNLLKMVENYGPTIQANLRRFVRFVASVLWLLATLEFLTLRSLVFTKIRDVLTAELSIGSLTISPGDVLLLHDSDSYSAAGSWRNTAGALPKVLRMLESRALRPVRLPVA